MRIIGGQFKGRRFHPPADNWPTRPTTDYAKEGLFNILTNRFDFERMRVLDLFGGTGSHSYEFVSRGCQDVTYVDKHAPAVRFVRKTVEELGIAGSVAIFQMDVFRFIESFRGKPFDYVFAGPPYALPTIDMLPDLIFKHQLVAARGWLVLEHNPHCDFREHPCLTDIRHYGKTIFSIFSPPEGLEPTP
jgi:16S rRNA (guanine(966)-N(2))-methyltransferase RsmD